MDLLDSMQVDEIFFTGSASDDTNSVGDDEHLFPDVDWNEVLCDLVEEPQQEQQEQEEQQEREREQQEREREQEQQRQREQQEREREQEQQRQREQEREREQEQQRQREQQEQQQQQREREEKEKEQQRLIEKQERQKWKQQWQQQQQEEALRRKRNCRREACEQIPPEVHSGIECVPAAKVHPHDLIRVPNGGVYLAAKSRFGQVHDCQPLQLLHVASSSAGSVAHVLIADPLMLKVDVAESTDSMLEIKFQHPIRSIAWINDSCILVHVKSTIYQVFVNNRRGKMQLHIGSSQWRTPTTAEDAILTTNKQGTHFFVVDGCHILCFSPTAITSTGFIKLESPASKLVISPDGTWIAAACEKSLVVVNCFTLNAVSTPRSDLSVLDIVWSPTCELVYFHTKNMLVEIETSKMSVNKLPFENWNLHQISFSLIGVLAILSEKMILVVTGDKTGMIPISSPISFISWIDNNHLLVHSSSGEKLYWNINITV